MESREISHYIAISADAGLYFINEIPVYIVNSRRGQMKRKACVYIYLYIGIRIKRERAKINIPTAARCKNKIIEQASVQAQQKL